MKKAIFAALAAVTMIGAAGMEKKAPEQVPATLVVVEAVHTPDFTGYIKCRRVNDYLRMKEGRAYYDVIYTINEDAEDLENGDILAVIFEYDGTETTITEYQYSGYLN